MAVEHCTPLLHPRLVHERLPTVATAYEDATLSPDARLHGGRARGVARCCSSVSPGAPGPEKVPLGLGRAVEAICTRSGAEVLREVGKRPTAEDTLADGIVTAERIALARATLALGVSVLREPIGIPLAVHCRPFRTARPKRRSSLFRPLVHGGCTASTLAIVARPRRLYSSGGGQHVVNGCDEAVQPRGCAVLAEADDAAAVDNDVAWKSLHRRVH